MPTVTPGTPNNFGMIGGAGCCCDGATTKVCTIDWLGCSHTLPSGSSMTLSQGGTVLDTYVYGTGGPAWTVTLVIGDTYTLASGAFPVRYVATSHTFTVTTGISIYALTMDPAPNMVCAGCGLPICRTLTMTDSLGTYTLNYVGASGSFTVLWTDGTGNHFMGINSTTGLWNVFSISRDNDVNATIICPTSYTTPQLMYSTPGVGGNITVVEDF